MRRAALISIDKDDALRLWQTIKFWQLYLYNNPILIWQNTSMELVPLLDIYSIISQNSLQVNNDHHIIMEIPSETENFLFTWRNMSLWLNRIRNKETSLISVLSIVNGAYSQIKENKKKVKDRKGLRRVANRVVCSALVFHLLETSVYSLLINSSHMNVHFSSK